MAQFLLPLSNPLACDPLLTGGKGASLARNARHFPVPGGFVVTADAYRAFASDISFGDVRATDAAALEARAAEIRSELAKRNLPQDLVAAVREALPAIGVAKRFAVRSSGTMEDLAGAAFAGQHDTFLGIQGADAVLDKIKACFVSLWSGRAFAYRTTRGFDHADAAMAVVVQEMVDADIAGVAFTIDPVGGRVDRISIDAAWGLGETVVSGEGGTDQFIVARAGLEIVSRRIGDKQHAIVQDGSGTLSVAMGDKATVPCLNDAQCKEIAALALKVEHAAGFPQDIEWAFAGGKLHLLQARPVTRLPERWTREESAERFPSPVTPLTWDFVEEGFHNALKASFDLMGLPPLSGRWFARFDGYIYGNQNAVDVYMGRPPAAPRSLDELRVALPAIRNKFAWALELPSRWLIDLDRYLIGIGALEAVDVKKLSAADVWAHVTRINALGTEYFRSNIAISITQSMLHKGLAYATAMVAGPEIAPRLLDGLTATTDTKTARVNAEIRELADLVVAEPGLKTLLETEGCRAAIEKRQLDAFPVFAGRFARFLADHGHRELDFDPYCSNWLDSPWTALDSILLATHTPSVPAHVKEREVRQRAHRAELELLTHVPDDLRFFYSELVRLARTYTALDDIEHYQTSRLTVPMRRALGEIGSRLVALGACEEPMDVYFAHAAMLAAYCRSESASDLAVLREGIARGKAQYREAQSRDPRFVLAEEDTATVDKGVIRAIGGSPGIAEGPVSIVRSPDDFQHFRRGAILVARTTNPAWTPLFHVACGVIVESGGPLSHGAVTAREMGIPAVMALRGAMALLKDGDVVRIDGARGTVERLRAA